MQIADRVFDRLVHGGDVPETHRLDFLVGELLTNETDNFCVGRSEHTLARLDTDILGDTFLVLEEHALENSDLDGYAGRGFKVIRPKNALGVVADPETIFLQSLDPLRTSGTVRSDRKVDDPVFLTPGAGRFRHHQFAA